ncbi:hypothetical protein CR513_42469, partial [Mucuna pruriens]
FAIHPSLISSFPTLPDRSARPHPLSCRFAWKEPKPIFVGELIPTIPFVVATPLVLEDSLTPKYPSLYSEHLYMVFPLSSHESLDINLMNQGRLGRRYDFKFVTYGSKSLRPKSFNYHQLLGRWWGKQKKIKTREWVDDKTHELAVKYQQCRKELQ